jgi:heat shock protein 4
LKERERERKNSVADRTPTPTPYPAPETLTPNPKPQRFIGCAAADKINMQPTNTIINLKKLIGLRFSDPEVQEILPTFLFPCTAGPDDEIMITVDYMGEKKTFTPTRLVAMVLSDLKTIAEHDHGAKVTDAVVSVPVFFTDPQRRAMLDACHISGLNTMRLLHETTATALAYGKYFPNHHIPPP